MVSTPVLDNKYEFLSAERKRLQQQGLLPNWYQTGGWGLFKSKYMEGSTSFKNRVEQIAATAAKHAPKDGVDWYAKFFEVIWNGWLSPSTPTLANLGTTKGMPVACSGQYIGDSVADFYGELLDTAVLTKNGFGTSGYLGDIRPRGSQIATGGTASGVLPVFQTYVDAMKRVTQGVARRGAWAGYLPIDHPDFNELADWVKNNPDDANVGWTISKDFMESLDSGHPEAIERYQKALKLKMLTGKGYFLFTDKVADARPEMYKAHNLDVKASNLCTEIMLHSGEEETFTCILASMNLEKYDEWKDTDAVFTATVFLDCVVSEFLSMASGKRGFEKAVESTEKSRALGLGVLGWHSLLHKRMIPFESFQARKLNVEIFDGINKKSTEASRYLAGQLGEPAYCKGYGVRNTHRLAVAPTMSTSQLMGGVSQGIEPFIGNVFVQQGAGGETIRVVPELLEIMKREGVYSRETLLEIASHDGSIQHVTWMTDAEKEVFRTAFEIDPYVILNQASERQQYICQGQSINLFFGADDPEEHISAVHKAAFKDPRILSLYYIRTKAGVSASSGECVACHA
jgi:ribonucleoside-diphosphate reductase alpha chain